ncbi:MAG: rRNA maturation RNase YbeY [Clostridia bacterium]|nr:rRNA maturation RNase YbeY [Clostridia bacterium]MBR2327389.1 rRNA maturation RNase YbeY [Clostridia bacterium]
MICFGFSDQTELKNGKEFKKAIKKAAETALKFENETRKAELSVTVCNDGYIRELNRDYRGKDKATDVLSFPASDDLDEINYDTGAVILGDIVISIDTAERQAKEYGNTLEREISFLTVHGMLHLLGFDHEISEDEEKIMFSEQKAIIKELYGEE